jgi:RNA recognition motif-containing protein
LEDLCSYFGPVELVKVIKVTKSSAAAALKPCDCLISSISLQDKITGNSAGYGFVKFWDRSFAESALQALNGKVYLGQEMRVNWAFPDHHKEDTRYSTR